MLSRIICVVNDMEALDDPLNVLRHAECDGVVGAVVADVEPDEICPGFFHVQCVQFFEALYELVDVVCGFVFDAKVIDHKDELNVASLV
jgi:hypothetical protein